MRPKPPRIVVLPDGRIWDVANDMPAPAIKHGETLRIQARVTYHTDGTVTFEDVPDPEQE